MLSAAIAVNALAKIYVEVDGKQSADSPLVGVSSSYFRTAAWHVGAIHEVKHRD
jgi:hypothetical protein